ncbi:MAG: glycoside hydrolase family 3 C-terminal domain-containing protein [Traorella sp.]
MKRIQKLMMIILILTIIVTPLKIVLHLFDNTVALFLGGSFWELVDKDENAIYYASDFLSDEERVEKGKQIAWQVEAEGATLLMNEKNALPLEKNSKVSLFSSSSVSLVYGGTGSGNVDTSKALSLKDACLQSGLIVNETLWDFYLNEEGSHYKRSDGGFNENAKINEVPWDVYNQKVLDSIQEYADAAIVVLSRIGGEGCDLEFQAYNYLALDDNEKAMFEGIKQLKKEGKIKKIIVLLNTSNALQVDFLKKNEYDIDSVLWIGGVGGSGSEAVADILVGNVNPSGSLVDTYCYDNTSSPAMQNNVAKTYLGYEDGIISKNASTYMIYQEGIYVGYKYYETRYEDYVMNQGNAGLYNYHDDVAFPFGYGLSYSEFEYSNMKVTYIEKTDQFKIQVKVTNIGNVSGKETIQVYLNSPYTMYDQDHHIEKAALSLVGFSKTKSLEPNESEVVTIYVNKRDFASYDAYQSQTYILDAGDYYLTCARNAHQAINNILMAKGYTPQNSDARMDEEGNASLTYKWTNMQLDTSTYAYSLNHTVITNQLSIADINLNESIYETITYLSRSDWQNTWPKGADLSLNEHLIDDLQEVLYDPSNYDLIEMPLLEIDHGIKLVDMIGLDYDDKKWDLLLEQLSFDEMVSLIGDAFHWTMPVKSIEAPGSRNENGPQGLTVSLFGSQLDEDVTAFTSEDVMAATFNVDLMFEVGNIIGNDCLAANVAILYGPGNNTHRTPYGGRNFEYYSEDGFLAGKISSAEIQGVQEKGVQVVMKHFALNDCEQERIGLAVWINEQAAREIYLKAFQIPFEEAHANGVMMAYTRWGTLWSGANKGLVTNIMRQEWGSQGLSITDNVLTTYVNGVDGILAGTSSFDAMLWYVVEQLPKYKNDPIIVQAMKESAHQILYAIANSNAMNGMSEKTTIKIIQPMVLNLIDFIFIICILILSGCLIVLLYNRLKSIK